MQKLLLAIVLLIFSCDDTLDTLGTDITSPDVTSPTVVITYPANNSTLDSTITVRTNVVDDSDISSVKFLIDDTEAYADTTSPYEYEWDICVLGTGNHTTLWNADAQASGVYFVKMIARVYQYSKADAH